MTISWRNYKILMVDNVTYPLFYKKILTYLKLLSQFMIKKNIKQKLTYFFIKLTQ